MAEGNSFSGVVRLGPDNKILEINSAAMTILGLSPGISQDRPLTDLLDHDPVLQKVIEECLAESESTSRDVEITKQGSSYIFELLNLPVWDERHNLSKREIYLTDISRERHKASLAEILDSFRDFYFEIDLKGSITNINKSLCEHLGYSRKEDILGKHFRHFTNRESVREVYLNFSKVIEEKKAIDLYNYSYKTSKGEMHIGETTVSPIIEGEHVVGARCVVRDITTRLEAEEELRKTKQELEVRAAELEAINRIAIICGQSLNLSAVLQKVCEELTQIFPLCVAEIRMLTERKGDLEVAAFYSTEPEIKSQGRIYLPQGEYPVISEVIEKKRTVVILNSEQVFAPEFRANPPSFYNSLYRMVVPLLVRGSAKGTVELLARTPDTIFEKKDIKLAEIIANQIAAAVDNAQLFAKTESALDVAERDLEIGRQVQSGFFPDRPPHIPGWEIATYFEPARQVAGDFYDYFKLEKSNMVAIVIGDVCDKGVGAALFMVLFRSLIRAFSRVEINPQNVKWQIKEIVSKTNDYIETIHGDARMFATLFIGIFDPESGIMHYINGGHEPPVLLNPQGKIVQRMDPTGPAVGIFPDADFKVEQLVFGHGDFLVAFTDGVQDTLNWDGGFFTAERLLKYIQNPWTSLFSMIFELKIELSNFMGGQQQYDDITIVSLRRKLAGKAEQHAICRVADLKVMGEVQDFVELSALQCELTPDVALVFKEAAAIAINNIIQSGFDPSQSGLISLSFEKSDHEAKLIIRDNGKFLTSPSKAESERGIEKKDGEIVLYPDFEPMRPAFDRVTYSRMQAEGNELILGKKICRSC